MTKAGGGGGPTPIRRISTVPSLEHCPGADNGRPGFSVLNVSRKDKDSSPAQGAFCRICLESKALPLDPSESPFPHIPVGFSLPSLCFWRGKGGLEEVDRLISPCACTGTQAYVHYTCLRAWQNSVVSSARYAEDGGNCQGASVCSVCLHRFSVQPPQTPLLVRVQRVAEMYARELIWFFLFLCIFYFLLACNLNVVSFCANIFGVMNAAVGLDPGLNGLAENTFGAGTVLVASPTKMTSSSIFYRSVVVVYENEAKSGGAVAGVIINKPIKSGDTSQLRSLWDVPLFLNEQGKGVPRMLGWGGPLARSAMTVMDMCPCCMDKAKRTAPKRCCSCACRASKDLEQSGPGNWARFIFPGLFLGTDIQSLQILEATALVNNGCTQPSSPKLLDASPEVPPSESGNSSRVVLMGHALWQPGQLEAEIRAGWWLVLSDIKNQDAFSAPLKLLWKSLIASHMGAEALRD